MFWNKKYFHYLFFFGILKEIFIFMYFFQASFIYWRWSVNIGRYIRFLLYAENDNYKNRCICTQFPSFPLLLLQSAKHFLWRTAINAMFRIRSKKKNQKVWLRQRWVTLWMLTCYSENWRETVRNYLVPLL